MPIRDYPLLLKEKGMIYLIKRITRAVIVRVWERTECELITWRSLSSTTALPEGFDLEFRSCSPEEAHTLIDPEIAIPSSILKERFQRNMRMYGVLFNGKITEYLWAAGPPRFSESSSAFSIPLKDDEAFYFDYKGIVKKRPEAFRHFVLMKAFSGFCMEKEQERTGKEMTFYSLVSKKNKISLKFHYEYLNATCCDIVIGYRFLFYRWTRSHSPRFKNGNA